MPAPLFKRRNSRYPRSVGGQVEGTLKETRDDRVRSSRYAIAAITTPTAWPASRRLALEFLTFSELRSGARERPSARPRPAVCLKTAQVSPNGTEASWRFGICDVRCAAGDVRRAM